MILFALHDLFQETLDVLATEVSIGLLDLILRVAEQLVIIAALTFSPQTRLNQVTCTFGHFRHDVWANVYGVLLCHKRVWVQYSSSIHTYIQYIHVLAIHMCKENSHDFVCRITILTYTHSRTYVYDICLHSGGDEDRLDRLQAFAVKHCLEASALGRRQSLGLWRPAGSVKAAGIAGGKRRASAGHAAHQGPGETGTICLWSKWVCQTGERDHSKGDMGRTCQRYWRNAIGSILSDISSAGQSPRRDWSGQH
jgi:hypothetical protein